METATMQVHRVYASDVLIEKRTKYKKQPDHVVRKLMKNVPMRKDSYDIKMLVLMAFGKYEQKDDITYAVKDIKYKQELGLWGMES